MELKAVSRMRSVISIEEISGPFPSAKPRKKWPFLSSFPSYLRRSFACIRILIGIFDTAKVLVKRLFKMTSTRN